ncbi:hypothetical protein HWV07_01805 [Natronomonas salina]|uniref:DUF7503 family protein n=1 Tax=Natronomonas salina TaxID=1710540 RepID=UPI0015B5D0AF|nr:hypothetical protein [Natronomonas salina]QLD87838.1 hypothetical protein HWV07_01805 [Natronomonas salina]
MTTDRSQSTSGTVSEFLAAHPRMTGVLFAMFLALAQAGQVAAGGGTYHGP